jgi:hypothetical protein
MICILDSPEGAEITLEVTTRFFGVSNNTRYRNRGAISKLFHQNQDQGSVSVLMPLNIPMVRPVRYKIHFKKRAVSLTLRLPSPLQKRAGPEAGLEH